MHCPFHHYSPRVACRHDTHFEVAAWLAAASLRTVALICDHEQHGLDIERFVSHIADPPLSHQMSDAACIPSLSACTWLQLSHEASTTAQAVQKEAIEPPEGRGCVQCWWTMMLTGVQGADGP